LEDRNLSHGMTGTGLDGAPKQPILAGFTAGSETPLLKLILTSP